MIQWLLLKLNKATMKVPPIPPPSVIETLILSKEFWLKALFFLIWAFFNFDINKKATRLRNKNKKSLRVVTVFWLGKSNGLPPHSALTYLLKIKKKRLKSENFCTYQFILFYATFSTSVFIQNFFIYLNPNCPYH